MASVDWAFKTLYCWARVGEVTRVASCTLMEKPLLILMSLESQPYHTLKSVSSETFWGLWCHFCLVKVIPIYEASVEDTSSWFISKNNEHPCPNYQHKIFQCTWKFPKFPKSGPKQICAGHCYVDEPTPKVQTQEGTAQQVCTYSTVMWLNLVLALSSHYYIHMQTLSYLK